MKTETQTVRRFGFVDTPKSLPEWKEHKHGNYVTFRDYERDIASRDARITALEAELYEAASNWSKAEHEKRNIRSDLGRKNNALEAEVQKLREALEYAVDYLPMETVARRKARAALNSNAGEKGKNHVK